MSIFRGIRIRHKSKRLPKESRTLRMPDDPGWGPDEEKGTWYRCWNCGFPCTVDRETLGDGQSKAEIDPVAYTLENQYGQTPSEASPDWTIRKSETTRYKPIVGSGCPFCGSPNWRGDY